MMPPIDRRAAADRQQRWGTEELVDRGEALHAGRADGSKVVPPMVNASAPMAMSPVCRPVNASPGCSGAGGVHIAEQRVQVDVAEGRHQGVGDGVGSPVATSGLSV